MSLLARILLGLVIAAVGVMLVWKTVKFQEFTGEIEWAESKLGPGGTNTFLKLFGLLVVVIGVFTMTNIISDVLGGLAGILVPSSRP